MCEWVVATDGAKNYANEEGLVRYPCHECVNGLWQQTGIIEAHIIDHGFNPLYKKWRHHGEPDMLMDLVLHEQGDNMGDKMLNVLEDTIRPTHELPTKDEDLATLRPSHHRKRSMTICLQKWKQNCIRDVRNFPR